MKRKFPPLWIETGLVLFYPTIIDGGDSTETLDEIAEIVDIENNILSTSADNFIHFTKPVLMLKWRYTN